LLLAARFWLLANGFTFKKDCQLQEASRQPLKGKLNGKQKKMTKCQK
jgi:hypothetical protein